MKKICLAVIMQLALCMLFAQKNTPGGVQMPQLANSVKDKQEFLGYVIRLMPVFATPEKRNSYAFDILKDNRIVVHQFKNPIPFAPKGIQKKEDAFKIGQWMITEFNRTGQWQTMMPPQAASELKIETN